jgi:protein TonB
MTTTVPLFEFMPYGAPELIGVARKHMVRATVVSSALAMLAFALFGATARFVVRSPDLPQVSITLTDATIVMPPPLERTEPLPAVEPARAVHEHAGAPLPVPESEAQPLESIQSQQQLNVGDPLAKLDGRPIQPPPPEENEVLPDRDTPVYVEDLPEPVVRVEPKYPDLAREMQVEGVVYVDVLVGKDGRVKDAQVNKKLNIPLLNESALEAARHWVFQPGLVSKHPVAVWVTIPFKYRLH